VSEISSEDGEFVVGKGDEISRQRARKLFVQRRNLQSQKMSA
jgi:hypothetical protein